MGQGIFIHDASEHEFSKQANAEVFGGDPTNILLMGHGTGAASASLLALSPRAEGRHLDHNWACIKSLGKATCRLLLVEVLIFRSFSKSASHVWLSSPTWYCEKHSSQCHVEYERAVRLQVNSIIFQFLSIKVPEHSTHPNCWIVLGSDPKKKYSNIKCVFIITSLETFHVWFQRLHFDDYEEFVPIIDGVGGILPEPPEQLALHRRKTPIVIGTTKDESSLRIRKQNKFGNRISSLFQCYWTRKNSTFLQSAGRTERN